MENEINKEKHHAQTERGGINKNKIFTFINDLDESIEDIKIIDIQEINNQIKNEEKFEQKRNLQNYDIIDLNSVNNKNLFDQIKV